ncbi:MAG: hypothetical protein SFU86_21395 [Pirellulaceae bacterium]|nr:hypothetical protein [Pirellulaceae bacterium]
MLTIFTLASGRSGTHFLYELFRRNAADCAARHEPYVWNPSMFGRPIYDRAVGDLAAVRRLAERKARVIERCGRGTYVETSHAFLKSWSDAAVQLLPNMKLVHLVRDPLKVARSEANREEFCHWLHLPLRNYRGGDGRRYFRWSLTGLEPIYGHFDLARLSHFQRYAIQWIEIENRARQFLARFSKQAECLTLHSPADLNNERRVSEMFDFLGVKLRRPRLTLAGSHNPNPRPTIVSEADCQQFAEIVAALPASYLEIFRHEPYAGWPWAGQLRVAQAGAK